MKKPIISCFMSPVLVLILVICHVFSVISSPLYALNDLWEIVDTPSSQSRVIVSPSEINDIAIANDGSTFYATDIAGSKVYKSTDGGVTWSSELSGNLFSSGATLPAWIIVVAPDDPETVAVVTNNRTRIYISVNGGNNWEYVSGIPGLGFPIIIADIALSSSYGSGRDIAAGTRNMLPASYGNIWVRNSTMGGWMSQGLLADITSIAFTPNYDTDMGILAVGSTSSDTRLHSGKRDTPANTTIWEDASTGFPVLLDTVSEDEIIYSQIEIPSDYSRMESDFSRVFVGYDYNDGIRKGKVCRVEENQVQYITPNEAGGSEAYISNGISSISYDGDASDGKLLACEAIADPDLGQVKIWRTFEPAVLYPTWDSPMNLKQPTGGAGSAFANGKIVWSPTGLNVYCATATAEINDSTDWANMTLPLGPWGGISFDESALSVSSDSGYTWNQMSLIDTEISKFTDFAVTNNTDTIYLASVNISGAGVDSIWRSTSVPLGKTWVRVLCVRLSNDASINPVILRNQIGIIDSNLIILAVINTRTIYYSHDNEQLWQYINTGATVTDLAVDSSDKLYILDDTLIYSTYLVDNTWRWQETIDTDITAGHDIATPFKNPDGQEWVIIGDASSGKLAYADFSADIIKFQETPAIATPGRLHVLFDEAFDSNMMIYAASDGGEIFRWTIGESIYWDELQPINRAFYGLAQQHGTFYAAWCIPPDSGVDRTLEPARPDVLIEPPEWDDLTTGVESGVQFNSEPGSIKASSNTYTYLWAIDNRNYDFAARRGCLWSFIDTLNIAGTAAVEPSTDQVVRFDPVSGRNAGMSFIWKEITDAEEYELWIAKDDRFTQVITMLSIVPDSQLSPACVIPAGIFECGHNYYWKVRAIRATTGQNIKSPWSKTFSFTVMTGLPVATAYMSPVALAPSDGACGLPIKRLAFSWAPFSGTEEYRFQLASDSDMTELIIDTVVPTTSYKNEHDLDYNTAYFWRVRAVKPIYSDWSPVFCLLTEEKPETTMQIMLKVEPDLPQKLGPWMWLIIAAAAFIYIVIVVLITRIMVRK